MGKIINESKPHKIFLVWLSIRLIPIDGVLAGKCDEYFI
jgi:hypothetical protein